MDNFPVKPVLIASCLGLLWVLEGIAPMFGPRQGRLRHGLTNVTLGLFNAVLAAFLLAGAAAGAAAWGETHRWGFLRILDLSPWVAWPTAILILDLWMYGWHVANHKISFLWRFHSLHHSDADLDVSSALRFHTGEILLSGLGRIPIMLLAGMSLEHLLVYELILQPVILLHHSNFRLAGRADWILRWLIVTPRVHWVHHSRLRHETDSNYGSVFSFWDRLLGTFCPLKDPGQLSLGLDGYSQRDRTRLDGMLAAPFRAGRCEAESKK